MKQKLAQILHVITGTTLAYDTKPCLGCFQALPPDAYNTPPARFQGSLRFCETVHGILSRTWTTNL